MHLENRRVNDVIKFEIELVKKQVQKIKQAKKDCQTHYGKQLGCGTCKALQLCMWIDELVDTIEVMRKHIEALQQENEQLQEFANAKVEVRLELPCKAGDTVYSTANGKVEKLSVLCLIVYRDEIYIKTIASAPYARKLGDRLFLTREEAERALIKQEIYWGNE